MSRHWKGCARKHVRALCATSAPRDRCRQADFFANSQATRSRYRPRLQESARPARRRPVRRLRSRRAGRPRTPRRTPGHKPVPTAHRRVQHLFYRCLPPRRELAAHHRGCRARVAGGTTIAGRNRALDESAAQHTRLPLTRIIENAGLAGRHAMLAIDQLNLATVCAVPQPGGLRRAGRPDFHEDFAAIVGQRRLERPFADPVDVAQHDATHAQCLARTDDDTPLLGIKTHDIEWRAGSNAKSAPLTDSEMNNAGMRTKHFPIKIDDVASLRRARFQPFDNVGVVASRDEADVLAVVLVGNCEPEAARKLTGLGLGPLPKREAQNVKLLARRAEKEVALVSFLIARAVERPAPAGHRTRGNIVTGREHVGAKLARRDQQVVELDRHVAFDARNRRLAMNIALGETIDHGFLEAGLVIENVVRNAYALRDGAGIVDVLPRATGAFAMRRCAVVVELQRHADHVIAFGLEQGSRHRRVDAAGHGDNDTRRFGTAIEFETVGHGRSYYKWRPGARNASRRTGKFCRFAITRAGRGALFFRFRPPQAFE